MAHVEQGKKIPVVYAATGIPDLPLNPKSLDELGDVVFYRPPHVSPRITAQRGAFTVHKYPQIPFRARRLMTITLAGDEPITYKLNLHYAGINQATLSPDLDGVAQQLQWQYKWGHLPSRKNEAAGPAAGGQEDIKQLLCLAPEPSRRVG